MAELFANDAYTTLDGDIDNNDATLVVADGTLFPTEGEFRIRIDDEFMLVTGVSGTTWTVERAVEGMGVTPTGTAASHLDGAEIRQVLTRDALMGGLSGSGDLGAQSLLTRRAVLNTQDDLFDGDTIDAKWTVVSGTWTSGTELAGWVRGTSGYLQQPVPSGTFWTIETEILIPASTQAEYTGCGLYLTTSSTPNSAGTTKSVGFGRNNALTTYRVFGDTLVNGAFSAQIFNINVDMMETHIFLRLVGTSSTNYRVEISTTGWNDWQTVQTFNPSITPTHFGLWGNCRANGFYRY